MIIHFMLSQKKDGEWTIFADCDKEGVDNNFLTPFLAISLIFKQLQQEGVIVEMLGPGSKEEKVWGIDEDMKKNG